MCQDWHNKNRNQREKKKMCILFFIKIYVLVFGIVYTLHTSLAYVKIKV